MVMEQKLIIRYLVAVGITIGTNGTFVGAQITDISQIHNKGSIGYQVDEICSFKENYIIYGDHEKLDSTDTKEACAVAVHSQYPNATGVTWYGDSSHYCYARFGNSLEYHEDDFYSRWSCTMNGIIFWPITAFSQRCEEREWMILDWVTQVTCQDACLDLGDSCLGISCSSHYHKGYHYDCSEMCYACISQSTINGTAGSDVFIKRPTVCKEHYDCPAHEPICTDDKICWGCETDSDCPSSKPLCDSSSKSCIKEAEYETLTHAYCETYELFNDFHEAKSNCSKQSKCGGVLDHFCDDYGPFELCLIETVRDTSSKYCVKNKKDNHSFITNPY